ncbi:hypothetical protein ATSB10_15050 [Dyella thiooxydans]|uniref:Benenodin family lasso peptide n=1 Tax=Dyella thiooxydans TaxID=445710 RepID=A0A161J7D8_9GAMM|nr:benenodin family lasso peptide [Dyella thiooxydans]AND68959.1 hypothetical protein ATSB10_15050 [Dyella thiooxydans]
MNTNENIREQQDDVIELGVASVETQGIGEPVDEMFGRLTEAGISQ